MTEQALQHAPKLAERVALLEQLLAGPKFMGHVHLNHPKPTYNIAVGGNFILSGTVDAGYKLKLKDDMWDHTIILDKKGAVLSFKTDLVASFVSERDLDDAIRGFGEHGKQVYALATDIPALEDIIAVFFSDNSGANVPSPEKIRALGGSLRLLSGTCGLRDNPEFRRCSLEVIAALATMKVRNPADLEEAIQEVGVGLDHELQFSLGELLRCASRHHFRRFPCFAERMKLIEEAGTHETAAAWEGRVQPVGDLRHCMKAVEILYQVKSPYESFTAEGPQAIAQLIRFVSGVRDAGLPRITAEEMLRRMNALTGGVEALFNSHPECRAMAFYGSWLRGKPTADDVDVISIVTGRAPFKALAAQNLVPELRDAFGGLPADAPRLRVDEAGSCLDENITLVGNGPFLLFIRAEDVKPGICGPSHVYFSAGRMNFEDREL